jgi:hypothetical protein
MDAQTMKETFEKLDDGTRIGNPAADMRQYPASWGRNEGALMGCYAEERIFAGKSHEEAAAYAAKTIIIRPEPAKRTAPFTVTQAQWDAMNAH